MPRIDAPGVYIEEADPGPRPIEGVTTSTSAFLGETERGPIKPSLIISYNEYLRLFGDIFDENKYIPNAVRGFFDNGGKRCYIARIVGQGSSIAEKEIANFKITAIGPGDWGNRVFVKIGPGTTQNEEGGPIGFKLQVAYWNLLSGDIFDPFDSANDNSSSRPTLVEEFDDLSIEKDSPSYFDKQVNNGNSALIKVEAINDLITIPTIANSSLLDSGGNGDPVVASDFNGENAKADKLTGLRALELEQYRDVAIVHAPSVTDDTVKEVIAHCENNRFRFAVIDSPPNQALTNNLDPRSQYDSKHSAYYYPWLIITDPRSGARRKVPPGGHVCGIYARTDNTRGVFKAPANEVVQGAIDLEYDIDHDTQENLNHKGVNVIRRFPGRGILVWGARTLSNDPLWRYVSVRRLFIFIEASIYNSTQWVVFEPNDEKLWASVKQTITLFLRTQWREGALSGSKEEEAFSVAVGRKTMTEDDILNGRLIIEVGIAPVRPAEYVIFRVFQKTQEATS